VQLRSKGGKGETTLSAPAIHTTPKKGKKREKKGKIPPINSRKVGSDGGEKMKKVLAFMRREKK